MKTKLSLDRLQIKSFITNLDRDFKRTIAGGINDLDTEHCGSNNCSESYEPCVTTHSMDARCDGHTNPIDCVGGDSQQNSFYNCTY